MSAPTADRRLRGIHSALLRYRVMAWVTGVVLAVMSVAYVWVTLAGIERGERPLWYSVGWIAHGWLFVIYLIAAVDLFTRVRWPWGRALLVALAGTVPFASFFAERWATNDVKRRFPGAEPGL